MSNRKTLQELTIKDNFMFGVVMTDEENCRGLLELALGFQIAHVEVSKEKSIIYHPEYKGIRLDVFAKDENNTHYNVEMQVVQKEALPKRARYYHSQIDMECLLSGRPYEELPDTYVIFICDFDPFGLKKYCYTFKNRCLEDDELLMKDGSTTVFLSTYGTNRAEVPESLVRFLDFVRSDLTESEADFADAYVTHLQQFIKSVKKNREMEGRFMLFEELLRDERMEGRAEGKAEGRAEGKAEGRAEGRAEGKTLNVIRLIRKKLAKDLSAEEIADLLEEDMNLVQEVCELLKEHPEADDEDIYELWQHEISE